MRGRTISIVAGWLIAGSTAYAVDLAGINGASFSVRATSLREARYLSTIRQQYDFSCGSAAVATLLTHHYRYPMSEQTAFEQMFRDGEQARIRQEGFSLLDIKRFLGAHGFQADGFQLPLDKLLEAGFPAIVLIAENGYHHFVVVKGLRPGRVLVGDPSVGTRSIARAHFEAIWQNRLLFVIHGPGARPRFNDIADWRVAPQAAPEDGMERGSLARITLPKLDAGDF